MEQSLTSAVIIIGAPGTGKTSVLAELGTLLELEGVQHASFESEALAQGWPPLPSSSWLTQLAAVVELQKQAGRTLFLVTATTETQAELDVLRHALGVDRALVVCLTVEPDVAGWRVEQREPDSWPGKQALVRHARTLAVRIRNFVGIDAVIDTLGRDPNEVAAEVNELWKRHLADTG